MSALATQSLFGMGSATHAQPAPVPTGIRTLKLNSLRLRNWKMFTEFTFSPDGKSVNVYGKNGVGKSTLMDAFMWLFFDKDSLNRKDFDIKPLNESGDPAHRLEHEVEATIAVDGTPVTLRKVFREKWTKKRGASAESFEGHETAYFVVDVPKSKTDYEKRIAQIIDEKTFRLLADPRYFNEVLHWTERRNLLIEICGGVSDEEVISADERLSALSEILGSRTLEEHRKTIQAQHTRINKELKEIPVRVSEVERNLPEASGKDLKSLDAEIAKARETRKQLAEQLARIEQGGGVAEKQAELISFRSKMADMEARARRAREDLLAGKRRALQDAQFAMSQAERSYRTLSKEVEAKKQEVYVLNANLEQLRKRWFAIDEEEFAWEGETVCYACGQPLPEDRLEAARDKALEAFNLSKSQRLEANQAEGTAAIARRKALEAEAVKYRDEAALQQNKMAEQQAIIAALQGEIAKIPADGAIADPEYHQLAMRRDALVLQIEELKSGMSADAEPVQKELAVLEQRIAELEEQKYRHEARERGLKRKKDLLKQEKLLTAEYESLSKELYLTEEFVRVQARMLESKVASQFSFVRFKLFNQLISGGLEEVCEATVNGVPYSKGLNNSAKIQAGIDIINTLSKHYGFVAPIWLDNRESVTWIPKMEAQVISLIVSPEDKELRIETEGE